MAFRSGRIRRGLIFYFARPEDLSVILCVRRFMVYSIGGAHG